MLRLALDVVDGIVFHLQCVTVVTMGQGLKTALGRSQPIELVVGEGLG